jgi:hypothetical protein
MNKVSKECKIEGNVGKISVRRKKQYSEVFEGDII